MLMDILVTLTDCGIACVKENLNEQYISIEDHKTEGINNVSHAYYFLHLRDRYCICLLYFTLRTFK